MKGSARKKRREETTRRAERRNAFLWLFAGIALLIASWALARWAPIRRAPDYELDEISFGVGLLIAGALPWFLQWAAIACGSLGANHFIGRLNWRHVLKGASVPLILGAVWWISLIAIHWSNNPLEATLQLMTLAMGEQLGGGPVGQGLLHGVVGPLTGPFMLHGPISMTGKGFLLTGLSTAAVTALWTVIATIMDRLSCEGSLSLRHCLAVAGLVLLWLLPVVIRSTMRVAEAV